MRAKREQDALYACAQPAAAGAGANAADAHAKAHPAGDDTGGACANATEAKTIENMKAIANAKTMTGAKTTRGAKSARGANTSADAQMASNAKTSAGAKTTFGAATTPGAATGPVDAPHAETTCNPARAANAESDAAHAPLQADAIQRLLHTHWLARNLQVLDETDSSNRVVLELAETGAPHGLTVIAEAQSAGRGRHGRSFYSPARRNLYTSILLRASEGQVIAPTLVFAAAAALAETTACELGAQGSERVQIKWPNDVLIDGLKTAGILMEGAPGGAGGIGARGGVGTSVSAGNAGHTVGAGRANAQGHAGGIGARGNAGAPGGADTPGFANTQGSAAVLGIGVNLNMEKHEFPEDFRARATSLYIALGRPVNRTRFCARLFDALEELLELHSQKGFAQVAARFAPFFKSTGRKVRVNDLGGRLQAEGVVLGIGSDGALRLAGADGALHRVLAGDVTVAGEESP